MKEKFRLFLHVCIVLVLLIPANISTLVASQKEELVNQVDEVPLFESIEVDKPVVYLGDSVVLTFKSVDSSNLKYLYVTLEMPISRKLKEVRVLKSSDGEYRASVFVGLDEVGIWKVNHIAKHHVDGTVSKVYNKFADGPINQEEAIDLSSANFEVFASAGPIFESISTDKNIVKAGEKVTLTIKASTTSSDISSITVILEMPITKKESRHIAVKNEEGNYVVEFYTDKEMEEGIWKVSSIILTDYDRHTTYIYNKDLWQHVLSAVDLSDSDFELTDAGEADIEKPKFENIEIDKTQALLGEKISFLIRASDNKSGIDWIYFYLQSPVTNSQVAVTCVENENGDFVGEFITYDGMELGLWKVESIYLFDNKGNGASVTNKYAYSIYFGDDDFRHCDFELFEKVISPIPPINDVTILSFEHTLVGLTFEGDVYIPEGSIVKLFDSTIKGNVYVLGAFYSSSNTIEGTINCTNAQFGYNETLYPGTAVIRDIGSVSSISSSNEPIKKLPVRFDSELIVDKDGTMDLQGATTTLSDLYINDVKIELDVRGRFDVKNFKLGENDRLVIKRNIGLGNNSYTITEEIEVEHEKPKHIELANKPNKINYIDGEPFDKTGMTVNAIYEDGTIMDVSSLVEISTIVGIGDVSISVSYRGVSTLLGIHVSAIEVESISLSHQEQTIEVGQSLNLEATINPSNATDKTIVWSSSNPGVVSVDKNGRLTALTKGNVTITATASNGKKSTCKVIVKQFIETVSLSKSELTLEQGDQDLLVATINPDDVIDTKLRWNSSNPAVAEVDENGSILALSKGETVITVSTVNGKTASCKVVVYPKVTSVDIIFNNEKMLVGESQMLKATVLH